MKIFLGSSTERLTDLRRIAQWIKDAGHVALPWDSAGLFPVGEFTFGTLNQLKDQVDAAIFIFGKDDKAWYRGDFKMIPRDNVLIEYGLFAGVLEPSRVAICTTRDVKLASDLSGVTYVDIGKPRQARVEVNHWITRIAEQSPTLGRARLMAFQNKFSMPAKSLYWTRLAEEAKDHFVLLGGTNKSWIRQSREKRKALGQHIARIIATNGQVAIVCSDNTQIVEEHACFLKECVIQKQRRNLIEAIAERLRFGATSSLRYQAVISDARIVVMPLLNSLEFKDESLVFELSVARHSEHHTGYRDDIVRTVDRCEISGFVRSRCLP